ncbi:alcohol dehydrogenase catalytic domain-containing protein [Salmonella enterica subsp. enterica serovar Paratyphi A]
MTLGHEFSGYVESYGTGVTDMQPGDAVACVPLSSLLFTVRNANAVTFLLCKQYQFVGSRSEGGNAEYVVVKRANLFPLCRLICRLKMARLSNRLPWALHAFSSGAGLRGEKRNYRRGRDNLACWPLQCARELGARSVTAI